MTLEEMRYILHRADDEEWTEEDLENYLYEHAQYRKELIEEFEDRQLRYEAEFERGGGIREKWKK